MIPIRLFSGKIKIIRAYLGKSLIFQSVALLFANAKLKLQNNLSPKKAEARVLSCYKEDATKSNPSVTTASTAEISFGKEMRAKIASTLIAYRRAAMECVRRISTKLFGKLRSTAGKNANAIRKMASRLLALLACAVAKILHLGNMIRTAAASKVSTFSAKAVTTARTMGSKTSINLANEAGIAANGSPVAVAIHLATLTTFKEPEPGPEVEEYMPETSLSFAQNPFYGYYNGSTRDFKPLTFGEAYIVEWDGIQYPCNAKAVTYTYKDGSSVIQYDLVLGNTGTISAFGGKPIYPNANPSGEPFLLIQWGTATITAATNDTSANHTVRIYKTK